MIFFCLAIFFGAFALFCLHMADREIDGAAEAAREGER
jgi:hypothetical protein